MLLLIAIAYVNYSVFHHVWIWAVIIMLWNNKLHNRIHWMWLEEVWKWRFQLILVGWKWSEGTLDSSVFLCVACQQDIYNLNRIDALYRIAVYFNQCSTLSMQLKCRLTKSYLLFLLHFSSSIGFLSKDIIQIIYYSQTFYLFLPTFIFTYYLVYFQRHQL